ncbi:isocitrate/isopropylmalate family dehydrogenase, partial [Kocuria sp.]
MSDSTPAAAPTHLSIAVVPGDGIGPEVVAEAEKVLDAVTSGAGLTVEKRRFGLGAQHWLETGETLTEQTLEELRA